MTQTSEDIEPRPYIERHRRNLPAAAALGWLHTGWRDLLPGNTEREDDVRKRFIEVSTC